MYITSIYRQEYKKYIYFTNINDTAIYIKKKNNNEINKTD